MILFIFSAGLYSQAPNPAEILQSFTPRRTLLKQFLDKCQGGKISLLVLEDRMGNKSKMTKFTTYQSTIIYLTNTCKKKVTYQFYFKNDTLEKVRSF